MDVVNRVFSTDNLLLRLGRDLGMGLVSSMPGLRRGFIRAEVVRFDDLVACGSEAEARKRGLLRTEGKQYEVHDGDVLHILFNV